MQKTKKKHPPHLTRFKCLFPARTSDYIFVFYLLSGWLWGWCLFFLITPNEVVIQLIISPWVLAREVWLDKRILPKNKRCNKFAHVSFSVVDRRCPTPTIPANGRVRGKNTTFGSVIKYRCSSSYKLQGPKTRTCRGNGKWDGETPICSQLNSIVMIPLFSVLLSHKQFFPLTVNSRLSDTLLWRTPR